MIEELAPREGELIVRKVRYDAFYGTELDHMLRLWNVKTILLCGTVANICVHCTAASAALRWVGKLRKAHAAPKGMRGRER